MLRWLHVVVATAVHVASADDGEHQCASLDSDCMALHVIPNNNSNNTDSSSSATTEAQAASLDDASCGLYIATSTIPGAGLGMFAAREIPMGEQIGYGDLVIQVEDFAENMRLGQLLYKHQNQSNEDAASWLPKDYVWSGKTTNGAYEAQSIKSLVPGLGALGNGHAAWSNVAMNAPQRVADLHRGRDPGAGASTTFHDVYFTARKAPIRAGEEFFLNYGDNWFAMREKKLGLLPLTQDFQRADELLDQLWDILEGKTSTDHAEEIWELLMTALKPQERMLAALPGNLTDVERVRSTGGTAANFLPNRFRTPAWLEENGRCVDNIRPGQSTVRQAGKGAFATRNMAKGTVVAPLPLMHVQRLHMDVYKRIWDSVNKIGEQLLLNYCFGHPESSLLLFPYTPVVNYVNHNKTAFNVELQWSTLPNHKSEWLEKSPDELTRKEKHTGLILEMIATRDIAAGEEIFLNYGYLWEERWERYQALEWNPSPVDKTYVSAAQMNAGSKTLRTEDELQKFPYRAKVQTYCFMPNFVVEERANNNNPEYYEWRSMPFLKEFGTDSAFPCRILQRHEELFTVSADMPGERTITVKNVPRDFIEFYDEKYTSDSFLRTAFRHEIGLPDELVPEAWRDLQS